MLSSNSHSHRKFGLKKNHDHDDQLLTFSNADKAARALYLKIFGGGTFALTVVIFAIFAIFWSALYKIPARNLAGWVVDFDGGQIGQNITAALNSQLPTVVTWTAVPASQFPNGADQVGSFILDEHAWVAITINKGSTERLFTSLASPNTSYNGDDAVSIYGVEARNENAYRLLIMPAVQGALAAISGTFAVHIAQTAANVSDVASILSRSPQTITAPIGYRTVNLAPFDIPLATAVTFVGLIYQLILSFFIVMIGLGARETSGLNSSLTTKSLIMLRFTSAFGAYLFVSLFYCLLSVAFQLELTRKFGHSGFLVFWMINYCSMLAVGLALESLITLLTTRGIPFFVITWIIVNVSVCIYPIEIMPIIFRYGYAAPFYNVSRVMRTLIFGTKNRVGFSFGILIVWIAISCVTLPLIQLFVRRKGKGGGGGAPAPRLADDVGEREKQ